MASRAAPTSSFAEIADELLELVRHDARMAEVAAPFMAGLPVHVPGITDAHAKWCRRMQLVAEAQALFSLMAPREIEHRALLETPG
jgi:hypothetical protein